MLKYHLMEGKQLVILYNFPNCSMLMNEITMHTSKKNELEFISATTLLKTKELLSENPNCFFIFWAADTNGYIQAKNLIQEANTIHKSKIASMAILNSINSEVEKNLKLIGVKDIFTHESHSADIIEKMEFHIFGGGELLDIDDLDDDLFVIPADEAPQNNTEVNLVVDANSEEYEEFSQVVTDNIDPNKLNLDSGLLEVNLAGPEDEEIICKLEDFSNNSIEIELSNAHQYANDDSIELNIVFKYNRCKVEVILDGTIGECEDVGEGKQILVVSLSHEETESLENFMTLYQKRQKSINDFMALAKGH